MMHGPKRHDLTDCTKIIVDSFLLIYLCLKIFFKLLRGKVTPHDTVLIPTLTHGHPNGQYSGVKIASFLAKTGISCPFSFDLG
jgi:hypothetical protein